MLTSPQRNEFSSLFSSFEIASRRSIMIAVSGGSDSTALLLLLRNYLVRRAPRTRLVAVTVDHALRESSAQEARVVHRMCERLDVEHLTLRWTGDKPATGISAAARSARHELLAQAARANHTDLVFLGHTADDQAETVRMRLERNGDQPAARGLAGIAPATLFARDIWFVRPLLSVRRAALQSCLAADGVDWIEDPSNADPRFERARMRSKLAEAEHMIAEARQYAQGMARRREDLGRQAAGLIERHANQSDPGLLRLEPEFLQSGSTEAGAYALRILLAVAGGTPQLPDERRAANLHDRLVSGHPFRTVLSRTLVDCRKAGIFLLRELRDLPPVQPHCKVWDGRYRIGCPGGQSEQLGEAGATGLAPESLLKLASACQPHLPENQQACPILAPWDRYLPSFDIAPARACSALIGAGKIPDLPFRRHD